VICRQAAKAFCPGFKGPGLVRPEGYSLQVPSGLIGTCDLEGEPEQDALVE